MIISVIVLYGGITSFAESVKQIVHPETPDYNMVSLVIVAVAVIIDAKDRRAVYTDAVAAVQKVFPDYTLQVAMDTDLTEE